MSSNKISVMVGNAEHILMEDDLAKLVENLVDPKPWISDNVDTTFRSYCSSNPIHLGWDPNLQEFCLWMGACPGYQDGMEPPSSILAVHLTKQNAQAKDIQVTVRKALWDALWEKEFPEHTKVKRREAQLRVCEELLEYILEIKCFVLMRYHLHTESCYQDGALVCEQQEDECSFVHNIKELLYEFFEIDARALELEKRRMLRMYKNNRA